MSPAHVHTRTHSHRYKSMRVHTYKHIYTCSCTHVHADRLARVHMHTHVHAHFFTMGYLQYTTSLSLINRTTHSTWFTTFMCHLYNLSQAPSPCASSTTLPWLLDAWIIGRSHGISLTCFLAFPLSCGHTSCPLSSVRVGGSPPLQREYNAAGFSAAARTGGCADTTGCICSFPSWWRSLP